MPRGRPREIGDEICSSQDYHGQGFSYFRTVKKGGDSYYYPTFRHDDRSIEDHKIQNWGPEQDLTEYIYSKNETIVYRSKGAIASKAYPIVIYDLRRLKKGEEIPYFVGLCGICFKQCTRYHDSRCDACKGDVVIISFCPRCRKHWDFSKVVKPIKTSGKRDAKLLQDELKKSSSPILKLNDIFWFLKKSKKIDERARSLLLNLSKYLEHSKSDVIITYGYDSAKESDMIADKFKCDTRSLIDYYGILKRLGKKVKTREKQKSIYNSPRSTLTELN